LVAQRPDLDRRGLERPHEVQHAFAGRRGHADLERGLAQQRERGRLDVQDLDGGVQHDERIVCETGRVHQLTTAPALRTDASGQPTTWRSLCSAADLCVLSNDPTRGSTRVLALNCTTISWLSM